MFAITVPALSSQRPAWAVGLCPPDNCYDANTTCVNNGGSPTLPAPTGETCYTLPNNAYDIAVVYCNYPGGAQTYQECSL
jgi:hypothetical protein